MEAIGLRGATFSTTKAGLSAGTTTTYSTTAAVAGNINGKCITALAAQTNAATPTTDIVTGAAFVGVAASKGSVFVYGVNLAGTVKVCQGDVVDLDGSGAFINAPDFPSLPADFCPFGYELIQCASTASTWTFGSSNQSGATGVTYTRVDVNFLPATPQLP